MSRRKSSRGRVLVSRLGRKNTKNINDFIERIKNDQRLSELEKRAKIADLMDYVDQRAKDNRRGANKRLTTSGFEGFEAETGIERMFANVGMSAEEISARYGFDINELLDPDNWEGEIFTSSDGVSHEFKFSYTGEIF